MIRDVLLSGRAAEGIEFFATVVGPNVSPRLVHDARADAGRSYDRLFAGGSEIRVGGDGVFHAGTGGAFCSYLFGADVPDEDLLRPDVRNRLVMHGARYDEERGRLVFSGDTAGHEPYARVFAEGHAFANFYFLVAGDLPGSLASAQEAILRAAGRFLKRVDVDAYARDGRDLALAIHGACGAPDWTLVLVKLVDTRAEAYHRRVRDAVERGLAPGEEGWEPLELIAREHDVDPARRERIHLDVLCELPDNKEVLDAYKATVAARRARQRDPAVLAAKLHLLRARAARRRIPAAIFARLDRLFAAAAAPVEPDYVADGRRAVSGIFEPGRDASARRELLAELLVAKRRAEQERYEGFVGVLLDAAREPAGDRSSAGARARYEQVVGYLDMFDTTWEQVSAAAFLDDPFPPERAAELLEARAAFDELRPGLFGELFLAPLAEHPYLDRFGHRRVACLREALYTSSPAAARATVAEIDEVNRSARLQRRVADLLREEAHGPVDGPVGDARKQELRAAVEARLRADNGTYGPLSARVFEAALLGLEEESYYASALAPEIVERGDDALRASFLRSSTLEPLRADRLEAEYLRRREAAG